MTTVCGSKIERMLMYQNWPNLWVVSWRLVQTLWAPCNKNLANPSLRFTPQPSFGARNCGWDLDAKHTKTGLLWPGPTQRLDVCTRPEMNSDWMRNLDRCLRNDTWVMYSEGTPWWSSIECNSCGLDYVLRLWLQNLGKISSVWIFKNQSSSAWRKQTSIQRILLHMWRPKIVTYI